MSRVSLRDFPRRYAPSFVDFPEPIDQSMYDEAVDRYTRAVTPRAVSVYRNGHVAFPGLSDIDMLVVVDQSAWDNDQFFSPFVRLPHRYHVLFQHRPHFVPVSHLDALQYSTFAYRPRGQVVPRKRLVAGRDALPVEWLTLNESWYWCCLFEAAISFRTTIDRVCRNPTVNVRRVASLAVTLRYPLQQLDEVTGASIAPGFAEAIDRARAELLSPKGARVETASAIHAMLLDALEDFERRLLHAADLPASVRAIDAARDVLAGRRPVPGLDADYVAERRGVIYDYLRRLRRMSISGMSIFVTAPYRSEVAPFHQGGAERLMATVLQRIRVSSLS